MRRSLSALRRGLRRCASALLAIPAICALTLGAHSASAQTTYEYAGVVTEATATFAVLTPVGTEINGEIDLTSPGPGGTLTDIDDFERALLIMGGFCFNWNDTCTVGAEVPIVSIDAINLNFDTSDFPVSGTIDVTTFSPTFQINLPITLNITDGTFITDNVLGLVFGTANFVRADAPDITLDVTSVDFDPTDIGATSAAQVVNVTNEGNINLNVSAIDIDGTPEFSATTNCGVVPAATGCTVTVQFTPMAPAGAKTATLTIFSDDPNGDVTVALSGEAVEPIIPANIVIDTTSLTLPSAMVSESSSGSFTVTNDGGEPLTISSIGAGGNPIEAPFSADVDPCTAAALQGGDSCLIEVTFTPTMVGEFGDTFNIVSDDADQGTLEVSVNATGTERLLPQIELSANALDFGTVLVGNTAEQEVTLSNLGTLALSLNSIAIDPTDSDFSASDNCPGSLAVQASCVITLTYTPSGDGAVSANLNIDSDDPNMPNESVRLDGNGETPLPDIQPSTTALDFGTVTQGQSSALPVTLTNVGTAVLSLTSISLSSITIADGDFTATDDCGDSLGIDQSCTVTVTFAPQGQLAAMGELVIVSNDPDNSPLTVTLDGVGTAEPVPAIEADPAAVTFLDPVVVGDSVTTDLTISNNSDSTGDLIIDTVSLSGDDAGQFALVDACASSVLAPGESCIITVQFNPAGAEGARNATLDIASNDPDNAVLQIALSGVADVLTPAITVNQSTLIFANTVVGQTTAGTVSITNSGDGDLLINTIGSAAAPINAPFSLMSEDCTGTTIAPGGSCTLNFDFSPTEVEQFVRPYDILSNDPINPSINATLEGNGVVMPAPAILVAPDSIDFGTLNLGEMATAQATVTNNGDADLTVDAISIDPAVDFTQDSDCAVLIPGSSCTITVTYLASTAGAITATLNIDSNDENNPRSEVALSGTGFVPAPQIEISPETLAFTPLVVGDSASGDIIVSNSGMADLNVTDVQLSNDALAQFSLDNGCAILAVGNECTITVTYTPSAEGDASATVTINSDDPDQPSRSVAISASATAVPTAVAAIDLSQADFGTLVLGDSNTLPITIANAGSLPLLINSVVLGGSNMNDFSVDETCNNIVINPGDAPCVATVTFTPQTAGNKSATLTINSSDQAAPAQVVQVSAIADLVQAQIETGGSGSGIHPGELLALLLSLGVVLRRRLRRMLPALAAGILMASGAMAQDEGNGGKRFYLGGAVGSSDGQADSFTIFQRLEGAGASIGQSDVDDTDSGYKIFAGYRLNEFVSFELGYVDLGEADININFSSVDPGAVDQLSQVVAQNLALLGQGITASAMLRQSFAQNFGVYVRGGLIAWDTDTELTTIIGGTNTNLGRDDSGTDFAFGVGVDARLDGFTVRAEWERFELGSSDAELVSVGFSVGFGGH